MSTAFASPTEPLTETPLAAARPPTHLEVRVVAQEADGDTILQPVSLTVTRGEFVAIAGGSGAGKSTLLDIVAGRRLPARGAVLVDGHPLVPAAGTTHCDYVPQDDIIHTELPAGRSLEHTAALRLAEPDARRRRDVASRALDQVGLGSLAHARVGSLSGGQRKRVCIAAELLAEPTLLVLDEPTSGLDPATAADLMGQLRRLAAAGTTVVLTTHSPTDLARCDRIVFLAPGGRHAYTGASDDATGAFGVDRLDEVYELLAGESARVVTPPARPTPGRAPEEAVGRRTPPVRRPGARWFRQWRTSTVRTVELIVRNPLAMAILFGSPLAVIGMLAVLFWIVFSAFFFGMTYGLLQIVTERAVVARELAAGVRRSAYVAAKVTVLLPFLAAVDAAMLWTLELNGQLPDTLPSDMAALWAILAIASASALGVGLATSALVRTAAQATLALLMLCFPQVLFARAVVPVDEMALPGRGLSALLVGRWGFEAFGRIFVADVPSGRWRTELGAASAFDGSAGAPVLILAAIAVATVAVTIRALRLR